MSNTLLAIIVGVLSLLSSAFAFPRALLYAKKHNILDNPNLRKLQRVPVPVFGGVVVYSGILVGGLALLVFRPDTIVAWGLLAMTGMLAIGIWDDRKDISVLLRLVVEVGSVGGFMALTGIYIDNFHGLWGVYEIDPLIGVPLSVFAGVGFINAINLIDGVDGYSSGYGVLACVCFAMAFWTDWSPVMVCMALVVIGSLLPFFIHNVFGVRSRMFIGDGGTLMLGMLMVMMSFTAMSSKSGLDTLESKGVCVPALIVAIGCIPLFDTVRVMIMRILRGRSPFSPDRTHLHHLFIDMRFSHLGAALTILFINLLVILSWMLAWRLGASLDVQMYLVILLGFIVTFGFYHFVRLQQYGGKPDEDGYPTGTPLWHALCKIGKWTHREDKFYWQAMQRFADGFMLKGLRR